MTRVTSREGVLLLLQEQLAKLAVERGAAGAARAAGLTAEPAPLKRLRQVRNADPPSAEDRARALVRSILLEAMDEGLGADPRFDAMSDEVARIIRASAGGDALVEAVFARLCD